MQELHNGQFTLSKCRTSPSRYGSLCQIYQINVCYTRRRKLTCYRHWPTLFGQFGRLVSAKVSASDNRCMGIKRSGTGQSRSQRIQRVGRCRLSEIWRRFVLQSHRKWIQTNGKNGGRQSIG